MPRANHIQKAERLSLARTLLQRYQHWPEAAQQLARNCSISERQAYRYLEQAQRLKHPASHRRWFTGWAVALGYYVVNSASHALSERLTKGSCGVDAEIKIVRQNGISWSVTVVSSQGLSVGSRWPFPLPLESRNSILSA